VVTPERRGSNVKAFEDLIEVASYAEGPVAPLTDWYSLAPIQPTGGYWYFSFECPACRRISPMFRDCSEGRLGNPFVNYGFRAICYFCNAHIRCASENVRSAQSPLGPGQTSPESEYTKRPARRHKDDPEYRPISGPLHHYTSLHALLSIVKTKALWATNVHYLNDSSESELGLKLMRQVGAEARKTAEGIDADFLTYFLEWLDGRVFESASVYVLCFSEAHNQLSQWRGYTAHGRGVCLSIDSKLLVTRIQAYGWTFQRCRYNQVSQLAWAEAILSRMRREAADDRATDDKKTRFDTVLQKCLSDLLQVAATIKNEAFVEEREIRFISPMINIGDEQVAFRVGRTALIPYVQFRLVEGEDDLAIQEIMVGPSPTQHLTQSSITGVATQSRLKAPYIVSASQIPYREL
jgi:Protein of unknown function (DUF2971)